MSILQKAVEAAATLDPTLGLELEQEFGADWQKQLTSAIEAAGGEDKDEFDPKAGEPMLSDAKRLDQRAFAKAYKVKDIRVLAETLKLPTRTGNRYIKEAQLVASIYKALRV